ncbi:glyoxylate/hydroxypyruvate reductase A [Pandoraea fibrosis]|uniref:Glyoxylate/hydroxypyruvate reductase A n=1 Tax=Pandoraea fibrosis TaxID=1891094 RepID=A0ABX6HQS7_9BURK|nr:glyoxylate/hydroxypyruvate reductase A [Pandoraea fibrosis]QHE93205.1 glyoxylate/hydroxypyruvate reductase A [Pandoraea fibrosis]QHF13236.1 glyoxylate/hydroxypyruvate reductase A [Pandoraea fibrosis]
MRILFGMTGKETGPWLDALRNALPDADVREWRVGDGGPADYALVWKSAPDVLRHRPGLKAIFNVGAGVDWILAAVASDRHLVDSDTPVYRIEDAGMASQMVEYATYATLRHFRRFDEYERQQREGAWKPLAVHAPGDFIVGVLGLGSLGAAVAGRLASFGFRVRGYSRSPKSLDGVQCFSGQGDWERFVDGAHVIVNLLPNTPQTRGVLNAQTFARLAKGAHVVNLARGEHLVERDLLAAIEQGQLSGATLDVFMQEPLPSDHPFWKEPRISITPHISAQTRMVESVEQMVRKIGEIELGATPTGRVDLLRGY